MRVDWITVMHETDTYKALLLESIIYKLEVTTKMPSNVMHTCLSVDSGLATIPSMNTIAKDAKKRTRK